MGTRVTYKGILTFHSETGTEGGYWAFQDAQFIGLGGHEEEFSCTRCGRIWDKKRDTEEPKPDFTYWVECDENDRSPEGHRYMSSYRGFPEWHDDLPLAPPHDHPTESLNATWTYEQNVRNRECLEHGHQGWQPMYPEGVWSYEGLHVLKDGDHLVIRYPEDHPQAGHVAWEGDVDLQQHELFTEDADGMWIHADQRGEDRDTWSTMFFEEWPAELTSDG
jgi:hypothetical protein